MDQTKKIYFASDFHLGVPSYEKSLIREKKVISWLNSIESSCSELYLMGDVFDFWFEHKHSVPKYYTRLLGTLARMSDSGVPIHFYPGNHDMWTFGYLEKEIGLKVHHDGQEVIINGLKCFIGHGDGLGPGDSFYKMVKRVFKGKLTRWLFARLHPNFSFSLANTWSQSSRNSSKDPNFLGEEKEWLVQFCKDKLKKSHIDIFIFGHRHLPIDIKIENRSRYINLGDWIKHFTYLEIEDKQFTLKKF